MAAKLTLDEKKYITDWLKRKNVTISPNVFYEYLRKNKRKFRYNHGTLSRDESYISFIYETCQDCLIECESK